MVDGLGMRTVTLAVVVEWTLNLLILTMPHLLEAAHFRLTILSQPYPLGSMPLKVMKTFFSKTSYPGDHCLSVWTP